MRAGSGKALHARLRKVPRPQSAVRFYEELIASVGRVGVAGEVLIRADSGSGVRDLKELAHFPSGNFAWTVIACLAHSLSRWVGRLGLEDSTCAASRPFAAG
jgi:hypothetical protein